jgi:hypothetical protein
MEDKNGDLFFLLHLRQIFFTRLSIKSKNRCCQACTFKMAPKFKMDVKMFLSFNTCEFKMAEIFYMAVFFAQNCIIFFGSGTAE